jgi:hypothetical protein
MSFARSAAPMLLLLWCTIPASLKSASAADDWQPITPEELKMTSEPNAPGAPAIFLYRQVDRDDVESHEYYYNRIKILTEEGRKYADVEIPFVKGVGNIHKLEARTIRPDGTIASFDGKIYDKTIVKGRGVRYLAKTFTLPEVQPGTVIEYRYTQDIDPDYVFDSKWILSAELFTKRAEFSLKQNMDFALIWTWPLGLPPGTDPPKIDHNLISLETQNVPAFQAEDHMPPEDEMKFRVEFVYSRYLEKDIQKFWVKEGKRLYDGVKEFTDKRGAMTDAVNQIVAPSDSPEIKLRKIYARTQQIRNLSFERDKTEQEQGREKLKDINNVEDVWKRGYGSGYEITWLFLALARAAGFDASPVRICTRNERFFNPRLMDAFELNTNAVLVKLGGKDLYFDPGAAFTPYGLLPWNETAVQGLKLDKDGGSWVRTPLPDSSQSHVERKAVLKLTDDGNLEGKVTVTFTGLEALWRRLDESEEDNTARKKFLEDEVQECIPASADVKLTNQPEWSSSAPTLVAEYDVKVPGWASAAGRRQLLPVGLFSESEKHMFEHADRTFPIYFYFPYLIQDDVTVQLPQGLQVSSLPPPQDIPGEVVSYGLVADGKGGTLHWNRHLSLDILMMETKYYPALRNFFQTVRAGDEQQVVLSSN